MAIEAWNLCSHCCNWWIRRNPMYLLSAGCMAVGARLYLVRPTARAGDVGLILLTLGILLAYEWAVVAVLLILHRKRRSPEDQPSLLLVSALFWTGPMAATAEMTARRADLGTVCAVMACAVALLQLHLVRRMMGLRISAGVRVLAVASMIFLTAIPPLLREPGESDGTNELVLYGAWWVFGLIALVPLLFHVPGRLNRSPGLAKIPQADPPGDSAGGPARTWDAGSVETGLIVVLLAAVAAHLWGMNYAYFAHAKAFYAAPLIVSIAALGIGFLRRGINGWIVAIPSTLPVVAIALAWQSFDAEVPIDRMPETLRDPLTITLLISAIVWWYGYKRHSLVPLLHVGSVALAWTVLRAATQQTIPGLEHTASPPTLTITRDMIVVAIYAVAGYLLLTACLRRSRREVLAAIVLHQAALTLWVWDRWPGDVNLVCASAGWCWLIALHISTQRPAVLVRIWPVVFLMLLSWGSDLNEAIYAFARIHAVVLPLVLLAIGQFWPWTQYRTIGTCGIVGNAAFYMERWLAVGANASAATAVLCAFAALACGAMISWYKPTLLQPIRATESAESQQT